MIKRIRNKYMVGIFAFVMIATISFSSLSAYAWIWWTPSFAETLEVTGEGVRFRREPVNGEILGLLYRGEKLQNDVNADHASYYHLKKGSTKGWSEKNYFRKVKV